MDIPHAIIKAVVQGLTEFLPVSSTAHLIFTDALSQRLGLAAEAALHGEAEFYDVLLHMGTLTAVIVYFRRELTTIIATMLGREAALDAHTDTLSQFDIKKLPWQLALTTTVTVLFALAMLKGSEIVMQHMGWTSAHVMDISEFYLANPQWVAVHLLVTGCLLFITETVSSRRQARQHPLADAPTRQFTTKDALVIGLFQGVAAIFHGVSRSGSTISGGLASGTDRLTAARYSFLVSIPVFCLAIGYETLKILRLGILDALNWPAMLIGFVVAAMVGYLCVSYFIRFVASNSLKPFAIYCWIVGSLLLVYLW